MSVLLLLFQTTQYQPLSKKTCTVCMLVPSVSTDGFMTALERTVVQIRGVFHGHEMNKR